MKLSKKQQDHGNPRLHVIASFHNVMYVQEVWMGTEDCKGSLWPEVWVR